MPLASPHDKHITSGNKVLELLQLYAQFLHKSARLPHWQSKRHCHGQPLGRLPRHRCSCTARSSRHPPNLCAARFIRARRCVSVTFSMPKMDAPGGNIRRVSNPELARNWSATLHSRRSISPMSDAIMPPETRPCAISSFVTREGMAAEGSNSFTLALRRVQGWDIRTAENEIEKVLIEGHFGRI